MLKRVLTGTILGLVLFVLGSATMDQVLERQASRYQSLIDLFFPLREKVDEMHLLLLQQQSIVERLDDGTPVAEHAEANGRFSEALAACFEVCFAMLEGPNPGLAPATAELHAALEPIQGSFQRYSRQIALLFDHLGRGQPVDRLAEQVGLEATALQESMARFEEMLEVHYAEALTRASTERTSVRRLFFAMVAAAILLGTIANVYFYRSLVPLGSMVEAVRGITHGHYEVRVPAAGADEVSFLAGEFNAMAQALGEQREAIVSSQEVIRATFDGIRDVLVVHDAHDDVVHANPAARALAELRGHAEPGCFRKMLSLGGECPGVLRGPGGQPSSTSRVVEDPESGRSYEVSCEPVVGDDGDLRFVVEFVRDITEKLQLERVVRQSEKLSAVGELSLGIAHEVRNPLSTIQMTLNSLGKRQDLSRVESERVALALHEVERLEGLVSSLLDYGRPSAPRMADVDVMATIERSIDLVEAECARCGVAVVVDAAKLWSPTIEADGNQVIQVLVNLLLNALQASPAGGQVRVSVAPDAGGDTVSIRITDRGTGIDREELKRVFTPFFTTRRDGTGLGLPVARKIAEVHGGELTVDSTPGRGTTAVLKLPVRQIELRRL